MKTASIFSTIYLSIFFSSCLMAHGSDDENSLNLSTENLKSTLSMSSESVGEDERDDLLSGLKSSYEVPNIIHNNISDTEENSSDEKDDSYSEYVYKSLKNTPNILRRVVANNTFDAVTAIITIASNLLKQPSQEESNQGVIESFKNLKTYADQDQVIRLIETVSLSEEVSKYGHQGIDLMFMLPTPPHPVSTVIKGWVCLRDRLALATDDATKIGEFNKTFKLHRNGIIEKAFEVYCKSIGRKKPKIYNEIKYKRINFLYSSYVMKKVSHLQKRKIFQEDIESPLKDVVMEAMSWYQQAIDSKNTKLYYELTGKEIPNLYNKEVVERVIKLHSGDLKEKDLEVRYTDTVKEAFELYCQALEEINVSLLDDINFNVIFQAQENLKFAQNIPGIYCEECLKLGREENGVSSEIISTQKNAS